MVRIAIAGGSSSVALEVVDGLLATGRHDILILSRQPYAPSNEPRPCIAWLQTTYRDPEQLRTGLWGVHTVLSFITTQSDQDNRAQKNLIDASIAAGVKRFAPSEWVGQSFEHMPWYNGKAEIRKYLEEVNKLGKTLEYTLFQPGLFTNYFAYPHKTASHFRPFQFHIDFHGCRALVRAEGGEQDRITLTTVQDLVAVVVKAVDFEGKWPVNGGVKGCEVSIADLIRVGEKVRGKTFQVDYLETEDLLAGRVRSSWLPMIDHPGMPDAIELAPQLTASMILAISAGALNANDDWNRLLSGHKFETAEDFLQHAWVSDSQLE